LQAAGVNSALIESLTPRDIGSFGGKYLGRNETACFATEAIRWPAAGFKDTLLRCGTKPEVGYGNETEIQPGVQA
jgi:hypothetical protein